MTDGSLSPVSTLPWPTRWTKPQPAKYTLIALFFAAFGFLGVAAGVSIFLPGFGDNRAYLLVLSAPLLFGIATIVVLTRLRLRGRSTRTLHSDYVHGAGQRGLVIPYTQALGTVYLIVAGTSLLLFGIIASVTLVALIGTGARDPILVIQAIVSLGAAAYLCWFVTEVARKRFAIGRVALTPDGIYHRSWAFESFLPWEQVLSVSAGQLDGQLITLTTYSNAQPHFRKLSQMWKQPEVKLAPHTAILGRYLSIDPALAIHTLTFYYEHPQARSELGTEAAVERVRHGDVLAA